MNTSKVVNNLTPAQKIIRDWLKTAIVDLSLDMFGTKRCTLALINKNDAECLLTIDKLDTQTYEFTLYAKTAQISQKFVKEDVITLARSISDNFFMVMPFSA